MNVGEVGGEIPNEVALLADELSRAVELTHLPTVSQEQRIQAYNVCESFKDHSPWCAQAGLLLASGNQYSPVVKHFGLKLMEHTIQIRWPHITQAEKIFIKENSMKLLYMGGWDTGHLNNALARVIVEMIKREWPQHWPTLLAELNGACAQGHMQTEIVMHIFLRLTEDVATLQTLEQQQRRKDIYQALTGNMSEIFSFFMSLIEMHMREYQEKNAAADFAAAVSNGRVVQAVLRTLTEFVEWVSTNHIVMNNAYLLQVLCMLLQDDVFQLPAAECLLQVVNRRGTSKEKKPLMVLFSEPAITCIRDATRKCIKAVDEAHYLFLKKLSQVLVGLAHLLTSMWSHGSAFDAWFPMMLETTLLLGAHPSLTLTHAANSVWLALLKHEHASKLPHLLAVLPQWLQASAPKILKVSYPASRVSGVHSALAYACLDYDSEQEFAIFFNRYRTEMLDSFRNCMTAAPLVTWAFVEQWTSAALDKVGACPLHIELHDPLFIEWEALSQVLDVVLSRLVQADPRPSVVEGLQLLRRCVASNPPAPLVLSLLLSFISALFVFLSCANSQLAGPGVGAAGAELLPRVLDKIFAAFVYDGDRSSRAVKNVRRHAAGLLVKLASKYPLLLLPVFGRIHELSRAVVSRPDTSAVESVTLQEALLLVSNHFCCYQRQSALVQEVLGECGGVWARLRPCLASGAGLARLIGLDAPPSEAEDAPRRERRALMHALALTLGVVKRTAVPTDPDKASRGGFGGGVTPSGNPIWRNPCSAHVLPLLPCVLSLGRALHELHDSPALRHAGYARALLPSAAERRNLLGLREHDALTNAGPRLDDRMQTYIHTLHENVCFVVGAAAVSLGREFFAVPGLAEYIGASLLAQPQLPDHWLRPLVRNTLRPLMLHCPLAHYHDVALPLLAHVAPFMVTHLSQRWDYISSLYESGKLEEEVGSESQEVLEDILVRNLTREYLEVLKVSLVDAGPSPEPNSGDMEEDTPPPANPARQPDHVTELGALVMSDARAGPSVLHGILLALTWADSTSSLKACSLALPAVKAALQAGRLSAAEAGAALAATLHALRTHGQHDANQAALLALGVQMYELLRTTFPAISGVLRSIPDADPNDLQRLDDKLSAVGTKPSKIDKVKRELFKKITSCLIGRDVGQLFKKEVFILDLPSMHVPKAKPPSAVDAPEGAGIDKLFATPT